MKKHVLLSLLTFFIIRSLAAQQIEGKVIGEKGEGLENVTVYNRRSGTHTHSNALGAFKLNQVKEGDTLQFKLIGYQARRLAVGNEPLRGHLQQAPFSLEQVVVSPRGNFRRPAPLYF